MARTSVWRNTLLAGLVAAGGCTEKLTTPASCPEVCPNSSVQLADTLLTGADVADTSVRGYVLTSEATYVAASSLDSLKSMILLRFAPVPTQWVQTATDTVQAVFPPDSVFAELQLVFQDTAVHPKIVFYRLPAQFDTTMSYAQAQAYFVDSAVLDTVAVPDSGNMEARLPISVVPAPGDSGVVSIGARVIADSPTVVAFSSGHSLTTAPALSYFVHGQPPQDSLSRNLPDTATFTTFVQSPAVVQPPPGVLAIGGLPAAHSLVHLSLPSVAVDSIGVVRATLLLHLVRPAVGFPGDSFFVNALPILRDYGPKSVLFPDTLITGVAVIHAGQTGTVEIDIAPILRIWGTTSGDSMPRAIMLGVFAEGYALGEVDIQGRLAGGGGPQLEVTYVKKYEVGVP
jgi:hypothetical protein